MYCRDFVLYDIEIVCGNDARDGDVCVTVNEHEHRGTGFIGLRIVM